MGTFRSWWNNKLTNVYAAMAILFVAGMETGGALLLTKVLPLISMMLSLAALVSGLAAIYSVKAELQDVREVFEPFAVAIGGDEDEE